LIWSHVVNHYLKGQSPTPFDILYWNSDPVNLPARVFGFYLRNMYLKNQMVNADAMKVCGIPIDLRRIDIPTYFLATKEDHLVPWQSAYKSMRCVAGATEFVLGASGHICGVINPPAENKRHYWINGNTENGPEHWLSSSTRLTGSWWPHWHRWLKKRAGETIQAPRPLGNQTYRIIEKAPGRYVKQRIDTP
jgi:polyhydroxyalkanoate synthase